jgi:hypothetical protein
MGLLNSDGFVVIIIYSKNEQERTHIILYEYKHIGAKNPLYTVAKVH